MKTREALSRLTPLADDSVVVCSLGMAANEWWAVTEDDEAFYLHAAMGFASSLALGVALGAPDQRVLAISGDGSLSMNLGTLLTEARNAPASFVHVVIANGVYQTVGATPMAGRADTDHAAIAAGAGIPWARRVDSLDEVEEAAAELAGSQAGPHLLVLGVEAEDIPIVPPPQPYEGAEMKYRFGRAMERRLGRQVFGDEGY